MPDLVVAFVGIVIFAQMFAIGLQQNRGDLRSLLRERRVFWRSLASVLLLVPVAIAVVIALLRPPPEVVLGLAMLAAAPGAPLTTRRSEAAGSDPHYVTSLQLMLALLAVIFTPAMLGIFDLVFDISQLSVSPASVARQIGTVTLLPVALGWLLSRIAPKFIRKHTSLILLAAKAFYLALLVAVLLALAFVPNLRAMFLIGWSGGLAVLAAAALAIAAGHVLGGPRAGRRSGLAVASVARNLGLALFIAELSPWSVVAIPTILAYALAGILLALPYSKWMKRQADAEVRPA